jgi:hypothetical protein
MVRTHLSFVFLFQIYKSTSITTSFDATNRINYLFRSVEGFCVCMLVGGSVANKKSHFQHCGEQKVALSALGDKTRTLE